MQERKLIETHGDYSIWLNASGKTYCVILPNGADVQWFQKIQRARDCVARYIETPLRDLPSGLYVDDIRDPKDDSINWTVVRTFHEAIVALEKEDYWEVVSLDHDLGCYYGNKEMTGRDILNWLIARKLEGGYTPPIIRVHSANPVGCATMEEDINRYWGTP